MNPSFYAICFALMVMLQTGPAFSHALHPESMDRHAGITFTPSKLIIIYQVIAGMNPTERYTKRLDADNDDTISGEERSAFVQTISQQYAEKQMVKIGDTRLDLQLHTGDAYASVGHNGMHVIKVDIAYTAAYPADIPRNTTQTFLYQDGNFDVPGWKQIQVSTRDGVVYDGYIPYAEYEPFDYEIIATKGFTPGTETITGKVNIPPGGSSGDTLVNLPERVEAGKAQLKTDLYLTWLIYGIAFVFVLILLALTYRVIQR